MKVSGGDLKRNKNIYEDVHAGDVYNVVVLPYCSYSA
jgi:uncharacterized protein (DUF2225 family)